MVVRRSADSELDVDGEWAVTIGFGFKLEVKEKLHAITKDSSGERSTAQRSCIHNGSFLLTWPPGLTVCTFPSGVRAGEKRGSGGVISLARMAQTSRLGLPISLSLGNHLSIYHFTGCRADDKLVVFS